MNKSPAFVFFKALAIIFLVAGILTVFYFVGYSYVLCYQYWGIWGIIFATVFPGIFHFVLFVYVTYTAGTLLTKYFFLSVAWLMLVAIAAVFGALAKGGKK